MTTLLVRAHVSPFHLASPEETLRRNLIGDNVGNLVFAEAVIRLLSVQGVQVHTRRLNKDRPDAVAESHDHLVIPLANAFRQKFIPKLEAMAAIMERHEQPVSIVGVGLQEHISRTRERPQLDAAVTRFVRAALERGPSIGVRGERTAAYLTSLGFGQEHVDVIGCPSLFMRGPELAVQRRVDALHEGSPISLNVSPYVTGIGKVCLDHAARYPHLVYTAQDHRLLTLLIEGHYPGDQKVDDGAPTSAEHPLIAQNRVRLYLAPQPWIRAMERVDFSFGTRIHGNIVALLAGTPAVVLAHDSRTLELAEYHDIPHRVLDPDLPPDAVRLHDELDLGPLVQGHAERWDRFQGFLRKHGLRHIFEQGQADNGTGARIDAQEYPLPMGIDMEYTPQAGAGSRGPAASTQSRPPSMVAAAAAVRKATARPVEAGRRVLRRAAALAPSRTRPPRRTR